MEEGIWKRNLEGPGEWWFLSSKGEGYYWSILKGTTGWWIYNDPKGTLMGWARLPINIEPVSGPYPTLDAAKVAYVIGIALGHTRCRTH